MWYDMNNVSVKYVDRGNFEREIEDKTVEMYM